MTLQHTQSTTPTTSRTHAQSPRPTHKHNMISKHDTFKACSFCVQTGWYKGVLQTCACCFTSRHHHHKRQADEKVRLRALCKLRTDAQTCSAGFHVAAADPSAFFPSASSVWKGGLGKVGGVAGCRSVRREGRHRERSGARRRAS
jgi:hypothetical protein